MNSSLPLSNLTTGLESNPTRHQMPTKTERDRLLKGEVLIQPHAADLWGAGVTAQMHLSRSPEQVWTQLTYYPRWVEYFPDVTESRVLQECPTSRIKTLFQAASKSFLLLSVQVEVYLHVTERVSATRRHIHFQRDRGSFKTFLADLSLEPMGFGTLLTYTVDAAPALPIPAPFIQEAIRLDLPRNLQQMRQVILHTPPQNQHAA